MASVNKNELTLEMVQKAMKCRTADELLELAKAEGYDMTKEEAESYMEELSDLEIDEKALKAAAGGVHSCYMVDGCAFKCGTLKDC
ncbi:MAG: hypothetical protein K6F86_01935 [Lachnospiraceae bacterium]|nr:hypothetical protein [Lachnospiraceae bacterium]